MQADKKRQIRELSKRVTRKFDRQDEAKLWESVYRWKDKMQKLHQWKAYSTFPVLERKGGDRKAVNVVCCLCESKKESQVGMSQGS